MHPSVRRETLSSASLTFVRRVHRSALSDNRIRASRIKRGILLKRARQLLHFDSLFSAAGTRARNVRRVNTERRNKKNKTAERKVEMRPFYSEIEVTVVADPPMTCSPFFLRFSPFMLPCNGCPCRGRMNSWYEEIRLFFRVRSA